MQASDGVPTSTNGVRQHFLILFEGVKTHVSNQENGRLTTAPAASPNVVLRIPVEPPLSLLRLTRERFRLPYTLLCATSACSTDR